MQPASAFAKSAKNGICLPSEQLAAMRQDFHLGQSRTYAWRREKLVKLKQVILQYEEALYAALYKDLHKSREECWVTELGFVIAEINHALRRLRQWTAPRRVPTNLVNLPSSSYIYQEPKGVVLIIGPWNYPFQLLFSPLTGALAAGNKVVLKPSEYAPATSELMQAMINECFDPKDVLLVEGDGATIVPELMRNFVFDHVFFTGGTTVGKIIYGMAAENLVPVTLELGGKSPCVVEADADIEVAAKRIVLTKFSNAGQMCVAPDYVLVQESVKEKLVKAMIRALKLFFSGNPEQSEYYGRIINERQFDRLCKYLGQGHLLYGGQINRAEKYIEPTIMELADDSVQLMREEIFGPVLPVLTFTDMRSALTIIHRNPDPLAFYVYTGNSKQAAQWMDKVSFGGGCINNSSWHFTNPNLPFGGRGKSGAGTAHGRYSFDTFSHFKSVMKTPSWFDPAIRYPPFKGKLWLFKKIIR